MSRKRILRALPVDQWDPVWRSAWDRLWPTAPGRQPSDRYRDSPLNTTPTAYKRQIGHALAWARCEGVPDNALLVDANAITAMRQAMIERGDAPATIRLRLIALQRLARAVDPTLDTSVFDRLLAVTPRRDSIRPPETDPNELFRLGVSVMHAALSGPVDRRAATAFRRGLVVALLARRPLRLHELATLSWSPNPKDISATVPRLEQSGRSYVAHFPPKPKSRRRKFGGGKRAPPFVQVSDDLTEYVKMYLTVYRPLLLTADGGEHALWVSKTGGRLCDLQLYRDICRVANVNPHGFRSAYATILDALGIAADDGISATLGHSPSVTYGHYVQRSPAITSQIVAQNNRQFDDLLGDDISPQSKL